MNIFSKLYDRTFQLVFKLALPLLPYRDPKILNSLDEVPAALGGKRHPLIVTDREIHRLGLTATLETQLTAARISYSLFDDVMANPTTQNVEDALKKYREDGCDCLIAVGGGSAMDCAKGVGARIARPKKTLYELRGILKIRRKLPLLVAVPTTAGTGSETTLACVIVDSQTRHKFTINDFPLIPAIAVLDERVTASLPPHIVSTTGMDALTHAVEAYIGRSGNHATRQDALEAARLILENIEVAYTEKTALSRKNMLLAAHKAGRAFSKAYVGYVHALAHALGGKYNTPHGLANAVILPIVLREYGSAVDKKLAQMAVFCNLAAQDDAPHEAAETLIKKIEALNASFGIPTGFDFIREEDIDELAGYAAHEANPLYPVPVLWDKPKLAEMFRKVGGYNAG